MSMGRMNPEQGQLWVPTSEIKTPAHPFFKKLNTVLAASVFDSKVDALCSHYYAQRSGRPSIAPGLYFRMLLIGYFEGTGSERGLAWRCQDSLSLKAFLGLGAAAATPEHSSLSVVRNRLPVEVFEAVDRLVLEILKEAGLLKGRVLSIDSSTMDANAAMRSIVRKDTSESYSGYVERLAQGAGESATTRDAQARFDKKREKHTTSNQDWESPTDPEARITRTKDGRTHLAYKPEHAVDIESGAIVAVTLNAADVSDHETSTATLVRVALRRNRQRIRSAYGPLQ